jgi:hypothetical protein
VAQSFTNQEREYAAWLRGGGYVCNGIGMGVAFHRVHHAGCRQLNKSRADYKGNRTSVTKVVSRELGDLLESLRREYGPEGVGYQRCAFCFRKA